MRRHDLFPLFNEAEFKFIDFLFQFFYLNPDIGAIFTYT